MKTIKEKGTVGELTIGMSVNDAVSKLGEYKTFKRTTEATETVYSFDSSHIHLTCDSNNNVTIISLFRPLLVEVNNIQILNRNISVVCDELLKNDISLEKESGGVWVPHYAILLIEVGGIVDGIEVYNE